MRGSSSASAFNPALSLILSGNYANLSRDPDTYRLRGFLTGSDVGPGPLAALTAVLLVVWFAFGARLGRIGFYAVFAFAVTASVQLVGVYLVFASLIVPALATRQTTPSRKRMVLAFLLGVAAYAAGPAVSALADLPSGAVVVLTMAAFGVGVAVVATSGAGAASRQGAE